MDYRLLVYPRMPLTLCGIAAMNPRPAKARKLNKNSTSLTAAGQATIVASLGIRDPSFITGQSYYDSDIAVNLSSGQQVGMISKDTQCGSCCAASGTRLA